MFYIKCIFAYFLFFLNLIIIQVPCLEAEINMKNVMTVSALLIFVPP